MDFKKNWGSMAEKELPFGRIDIFKQALAASVPGVALYHDGRLADGGYHVSPGLKLTALQLDHQPALSGGHIVRRQVVQGPGGHV